MNPLIGTWKLVISEWRSDDGQAITPMGRDALGYIIYTEDGHMAYQIMAADRPNFAAGDVRGGTQSEKTAAFETFAAYSGTYDVEGTTVVHHVALSLFPNWVGADQPRTFTVSGDKLDLKTAPVLFGGQLRTGHVVFRYAGKQAPTRL